MARAPDERIEQAKKMYLKGQKLVEIASQLNLPEGTVRRWKCTHKWDSERSDKKSERSERKKGGQPGNKNATGPPGNKNAVKTGEFETLFFDALNPDEKRLIELVQPDKEQLLLQEIQLLAVRERRMLHRIETLRSIEEQSETDKDDLYKVPSGMSVVKYKTGIEEGILGQIQSIEDALTRVQARRQKSIEMLHKFGYDDARLELEAMKFELELLKQDGSDTDQGDDGFLDAMNAVAADVWGDTDE